MPPAYASTAANAKGIAVRGGHARQRHLDLEVEPGLPNGHVELDRLAAALARSGRERDLAEGIEQRRPCRDLRHATDRRGRAAHRDAGGGTRAAAEALVGAGEAAPDAHPAAAWRR